MNTKKRLLLALGIIVLDLLIFFMPLAAFFCAYVILYNPTWVRDFLDGLGKGSA